VCCSMRLTGVFLDGPEVWATRGGTGRSMVLSS